MVGGVPEMLLPVPAACSCQFLPVPAACSCRFLRRASFSQEQQQAAPGPPRSSLPAQEQMSRKGTYMLPVPSLDKSGSMCSLAATE